MRNNPSIRIQKGTEWPNTVNSSLIQFQKSLYLFVRAENVAAYSCAVRTIVLMLHVQKKRATID